MSTCIFICSVWPFLEYFINGAPTDYSEGREKPSDLPWNIGYTVVLPRFLFIEHYYEKSRQNIRRIKTNRHINGTFFVIDGSVARTRESGRKLKKHWVWEPIIQGNLKLIYQATE